MNSTHRSINNYHAGLAAEDAVARHYSGDGCSVDARRWRGKSGEIDLVLRKGAELIFVEVKKSTDFATAAARVTRSQLARICRAAEEYVASEPAGLLTQMRIDVALVNDRGETELIENATLI